MRFISSASRNKFHERSRTEKESGHQLRPCIGGESNSSDNNRDGFSLYFDGVRFEPPMLSVYFLVQNISTKMKKKTAVELLEIKKLDNFVQIGTSFASTPVLKIDSSPIKQGLRLRAAAGA
jgi:hypothetical protein